MMLIIAHLCGGESYNSYKIYLTCWMVNNEYQPILIIIMVRTRIFINPFFINSLKIINKIYFTYILQIEYI
jgi:hypothetical protein